MSGTIPPNAQGRWRGQRGRGPRGPNRVPTHPTMPLPDDTPAAEATGEITDDDSQSPASDRSGRIDAPKPPLAVPSTQPPTE